MSHMRITYDLIKRRHDAYRDEGIHFAEMFPDGVEVTPGLCGELCEEFDWELAAIYMLRPGQLSGFEAVERRAWVKRVRADRKAEAGFTRATHKLFAEYRRKTSKWSRLRLPALARYKKARGPKSSPYYERLEQDAWDSYEDANPYKQQEERAQKRLMREGRVVAASKRCERARRQALVEYQRTIARAFAKAFAESFGPRTERGR